MRIAIIGTGIAGNTAAYCLSQAGLGHVVTVYERDKRVGGHSATVDIDYDGTPIAVDTGFIVYNEHNYPNMVAMYRHLGVETQVSDMSFSVSIDRGAFEWAGKSGSAAHVLNGLFAQRGNALSPRYWSMLAEILRFQKQTVVDLESGFLADMGLGQYLVARGFSDAFRDRYIVPMGAAIWSTPAKQMLDFPATSFVSFFDNHRLLQWDRPIWRTVTGGSRQYVAKLTAGFKHRIRTGVGVVGVEREAEGVRVIDDRGGSELFDQVVIAAHAPDALAMLRDASPEERALLGAVRYRFNDVYLHRDTRLMPRRKAAWAAWNFLQEDDDGTKDVAVTYWMNKLQGIDADKPLFVSLNPPFAPDPAKVFGRYAYDHPQYDRAALAAQQSLETIQGRDRIWFCGAWTGYGFHEDGLKAGLLVAKGLGAGPPWETRPQTTPVGAAFAEAAE